VKNNTSLVKLLDLSRNPVETELSLNKCFSDAQAEYVSKKDWKQLNLLGLLKAVRGIHSDVFIIAVDDFAAIQDEMLFTLLGIMASSRQFMFLETCSGKTKQITRLGFFFKHLPLLLLNLVSTLLFSVLFVASTLMFRCLLWIRQNPINRHYDLSGAFNKIAYLKTDMAFNIKAGGSITHTRGVIKGFRNNGKNILVLSNEDAPWLTFEDIPVIVLKRTRLFSFFRETERMVNGFIFAFRAIHVFRKFQPEVIYQRQCPFDLSGLMLSLWFSIPLILESNNSDVKGTYWDRLRFKKVCALVERTLMFGSSIIVTISEPMREILCELKYPSHKIHVLYNGVDCFRFNTRDQQHLAKSIREDLGVDEDDILVGFIGTFGQWHGIPTLTETIIETLSRNRHLKYVLIGDGELKPDAEKQIQESGFKDRVIFTGLLAADAVGAYLAACDILVSPHSKSPDGKKFFGSPTKLFEYMAANRAIVASDLDQIGEILEHGRTALLVKPNNSKELSLAIEKLAKDEVLRVSMANEARSEVEKKYTWKKNVQQVIALMEKS